MSCCILVVFLLYADYQVAQTEQVLLAYPLPCNLYETLYNIKQITG